MTARTRPPVLNVCDVCRKPTKSGHRYCGDHRDPRALPTGGDMLRWIEAQQCPLCADGRTFRVLANHTVKAHGVTGDDLRVAAGLAPESSICSPEHHETQSAHVKANPRGLENLLMRQTSGSPARHTAARMRAYLRLVEAHRDEYARLYAEEMARDEA